MHGTVRTTERLTGSMVRLVLGGDGLAGFALPEGEPTDAYVNLAIAPPGSPYGTVFDPRQVRAEHAREAQPARRRYTVRAWDAASGELTIDFVVHGDAGVAGPWAAAARPGDVLVLEGPGGGYRPRADAAHHLMVGDESALPAIAASAGAVPGGVPLTVLLVCDGPEHELPIESGAALDLRWLHRRPEVTSGTGSGTELLDELVGLTLPASGVHCFVHGEADEIRGIRRHLLADRGYARADMSCSPYWRRTMTDEAWREVKREFVAAMDDDL